MNFNQFIKTQSVLHVARPGVLALVLVHSITERKRGTFRVACLSMALDQLHKLWQDGRMHHKLRVWETNTWHTSRSYTGIWNVQPHESVALRILLIGRYFTTLGYREQGHQSQFAPQKLQVFTTEGKDAVEADQHNSWIRTVKTRPSSGVNNKHLFLDLLINSLLWNHTEITMFITMQHAASRYCN